MLVVGVLAVTAAGCGGGDGEVGTNSQSRPTVPGARVVDVLGTNFAYSPAVITAAPGEQLAIHLKSEGSRHDLVVVVDGTPTRIVLADNGKTIEGGLTAPAKPGTYEIYCSMIGHKSEGMVGQLTVA